jgi:hypothetical protein
MNKIFHKRAVDITVYSFINLIAVLHSKIYPKVFLTREQKIGVVPHSAKKTSE